MSKMRITLALEYEGDLSAELVKQHLYSVLNDEREYLD